MNNPHHIVAHPGLTNLKVGDVISEPQIIAQSNGRGAILLPVDSEHLLTSKLGGFIRRDWGQGGWAFNLNRGEGGCPLALEVPPGPSRIYWAAELRRLDSKLISTGKLQLWCDASSSSTLNSGLRNIDPAVSFEIGPDGFFARGVAQFNGSAGFLGLGLWGVCTNVAVRWLAVSSQVGT